MITERASKNWFSRASALSLASCLFLSACASTPEAASPDDGSNDNATGDDSDAPAHVSTLDGGTPPVSPSNPASSTKTKDDASTSAQAGSDAGTHDAATRNAAL